jgi:hypothetical protein
VRVDFTGDSLMGLVFQQISYHSFVAVQGRSEERRLNEGRLPVWLGGKIQIGASFVKKLNDL